MNNTMSSLTKSGLVVWFCSPYNKQHTSSLRGGVADVSIQLNPSKLLKVYNFWMATLLTVARHDDLQSKCREYYHD
jgi:hypothetical protein